MPQPAAYAPWLLACTLLAALLVGSCLRLFWRPALALAWVAVLAVFYVLMHGGWLGLSVVETARWGGLPPAIHTLCVVYV